MSFAPEKCFHVIGGTFFVWFNSSILLHESLADLFCLNIHVLLGARAGQIHNSRSHPLRYQQGVRLHAEGGEPPLHHQNGLGAKWRGTQLKFLFCVLEEFRRRWKRSCCANKSRRRMILLCVFDMSRFCLHSILYTGKYALICMHRSHSWLWKSKCSLSV